MRIVLPEGRYVVALSGGVDSCVLLDCLVNSNPDLVVEGKLIVAHFDHGIRKSSNKDALFAEELAERYGLQFVVGHGGLGPKASEETARKARYAFLEMVKENNHATAIITAHHRDDIVETAIINMLRGTGRRGLSSLATRQGLIRPLLGYYKNQLINYAKENKLNWVEDETNQETHYLRNRVRKLISDEKSKEKVSKLLAIIDEVELTNQKIEIEISRLLYGKLRRFKNVIPRRWFLTLPYDISCEAMHSILKDQKVSEIDSKLIDLTVVFMKTGKIGKKIDLDKNHYLLLTKRSGRIASR